MTDVDLIASPDSPFDPWVRKAVSDLRDLAVAGQEREWNRLLEGTRRAITRPNSIDVLGTIDVLRESIALIGPSRWYSVPWAVYISGLYAFIVNDERALPDMAKHSAAVVQMRPYTNGVDVERCRELVEILREVPSGS